jgi:hypothetical protein
MPKCKAINSSLPKNSSKYLDSYLRATFPISRPWRRSWREDKEMKENNKIKRREPKSRRWKWQTSPLRIYPSNFSTPSLCVTYTILRKCYNTLFSSVRLHYSIPMWIYSHESSLNSIFAYAKHKILITTLYLGGSSFPIIELAIQTLNPYLVSQASSHISLITEIIRNLKC